MANKTTLNILCALQAEARPLVDFYKLTKNAVANSLDLFTGDSDAGQINLVISGIGPLNMAAAVAWLASTSAQTKSDSMFPAWLNVGTAGHRDLPIGTAVRVAHSSGDLVPRDMYLPLVARWAGKVGALHSVSKLASAYPENALVDMEGSAFFSTATKFAPAELVQAVKIVSDNQKFGVELLNGAKLTELVADNIDDLAAFACRLRILARAVPAHPQFLQELENLTQHLSLTKSHQLQLRELVYKSLNLGVSSTQLENDILLASNVINLLSKLRTQVAEQAPSLDRST